MQFNSFGPGSAPPHPLSPEYAQPPQYEEIEHQTLRPLRSRSFQDPTRAGPAPPPPLLTSRAGSTLPDPQLASNPGSQKNLWARARTVVRETSRDSLASLKRSASIAAKGTSTLPPAYQPNVDLPPAYGSSSPPPYESQYGQVYPLQTFDSAIVPATNQNTHSSILSNSGEQLQPEQVEHHSFCSRLWHATVIFLATCITIAAVGGWIIWLTIPTIQWSQSREEYFEGVKDWSIVNCTVLAQSCWNRCLCSGCSQCSCDQSCCSSASDCIRNNYYMSQNCVWLSQSKYVQDPVDYQVRVEVNDQVAQGTRLTSSSTAIVSTAAALCAGVFFGAIPKRYLLLLSLLFVVFSATSANNCKCNTGGAVTMLLETHGESPVQGSREHDCRSNEEDAFCKSHLRYAGKSCRTLEDLENEPYCQEDYLNNVGKVLTCHVNPNDPADLYPTGSIQVGAKNWNTWVIIGAWVAFTLCCGTCVFKTVYNCCTCNL